MFIAHSLPKFFPFGFIGLWMAMTWLISLSGWRQLARHFRARSHPAAVFYQSYWLQSATLRRPEAALSGSRYGGVLRLQYGPQGLRLSVLLPFRFGHPPLLIPWSALGAPQERRGTWGMGTYYVVTVALPGGTGTVEIQFIRSVLADTITDYQQLATFGAG